MTPRDRRALALGAMVAAGAWLGLRAIPWSIRELRARRERLAARAELLTRSRADVRDAESLADSVPAVQQRIVGLAATLLSGGRESEAVAALAGQASTLAAGVRVRVVRTAAMPDSERAGRLRRATIQTLVEGDSPGVLGLLARLESGPAALEVADLRLTALDPASPSKAPEIVSGEIVIRGWYVVSALPESRP